MNPWLINRSLKQLEESDNIKVVAKVGDIVDSDVSIETRVSYKYVLWMNPCLILTVILIGPRDSLRKVIIKKWLLKQGI